MLKLCNMVKELNDVKDEFFQASSLSFLARDGAHGQGGRAGLVAQRRQGAAAARAAGRGEALRGPGEEVHRGAPAAQGEEPHTLEQAGRPQNGIDN